jgi:DNA-directed RNA polymerase
VLQSVTLRNDSDDGGINSRKQVTAFPPNFIHSLDATHMFMTCVKMQEQNLSFAAVHDSYWTHAGDIPVLNKVKNDL